MAPSSPCRSDGTPIYNGRDNLGGTCLSVKGNLVQVISNIGDEDGNSKYLRDTILLE
jgi:hypothetical protein